jgi:hypothetical protein
VDNLDINNLWRQVPPEEKFELMASAHSQGTLAAVTAIIIGMTIAVSLKQPWLIWGSLLFGPLIFQATSVKAWKHLKPRVILEYLAARSAARRFAFSLNSSKLSIASIMRGTIREVSDLDHFDEAQNSKNGKPVWIALFHDALVVISEQAGGAKLELGQHLAKQIEVSGESPSGMGEYASDREIMVGLTTVSGLKRNYILTSNHPAALVVLEKSIYRLIEQSKQERSLLQKLVVPQLAAEADEFPNFGF